MKTTLMSKAAPIFNSTAVRIALNLAEDRVAAVIAAHFPLYLDSDTLDFAVENTCFDFVHSVFLAEKTEYLDSR